MHRGARQLLDDGAQIAGASDQLLTGLNRDFLGVFSRHRRTLQQRFVVYPLRGTASDLADLLEDRWNAAPRAETRDALGNVERCFSQNLWQESREPGLHRTVAGY